MEESPGNGSKYISLQPFIHQVGGHSSLLCLDEATICKSMRDREQLFYETIPESLKSFVPSYYGIIKVRLIQDGDYVTLSATTPANYKLKPSRNLKQLRMRRNGNIEMDGVSGDIVFDASDVSATLNPWVLKRHKKFISGLISHMEEHPGPRKFIVLENLTWRFSLPCILDLKMGTRQYGDNESLAKKQRKTQKLITTTSIKLGVRITGMQVYQASSGQFLCLNKEYGRTLTAAGFQNAVRNFLHDGTRLRTDVLPPLIRRLEELRGVLMQLESLRLYTTSLLLLYEGHPTIGPVLAEGTTSTFTWTPITPFEENTGHSTTQAGYHSSYSGEASGQCQNGQFEATVESSCEHRARRASSEERDHDKLAPPAATDYRSRSSSCSKHERKPYRPVGVVGKEPLTDVRIVDFAKSTHAAMEDKVLYSGPDNGFLFGLNNMIQLLKSIFSDSPQQLTSLNY